MPSVAVAAVELAVAVMAAVVAAAELPRMVAAAAVAAVEFAVVVVAAFMNQATYDYEHLRNNKN